MQAGRCFHVSRRNRCCRRRSDIRPRKGSDHRRQRRLWERMPGLKSWTRNIRGRSAELSISRLPAWRSERKTRALWRARPDTSRNYFEDRLERCAHCTIPIRCSCRTSRAKTRRGSPIRRLTRRKEGRRPRESEVYPELLLRHRIARLRVLLLLQRNAILRSRPLRSEAEARRTIRAPYVHRNEPCRGIPPED